MIPLEPRRGTSLVVPSADRYKRGRERRWRTFTIAAPDRGVSRFVTAATSRLEASEQPEQAIEALSSTLGEERLPKPSSSICSGPGASRSWQSGDTVADEQDAKRVVELIGEGVTWTDLDEQTKVASFGSDPLAVPLPAGVRRQAVALRSRDRRRRAARSPDRTQRDLDARDAPRLRRGAARVLEEAAPLGEPPRFAQFFGSSEGTRNGLYWPTAEGEDEEPAG